MVVDTKSTQKKGADEMTDTRSLRSTIDESGIKLKSISDSLGITYQALLNKLNGDTEFKVTEAQSLKDVLHLTDEDFISIFFEK